jgi:hypothetical protein
MRRTRGKFPKARPGDGARARKTVRLHGDAAGRREIEPCAWHDHAVTVTGESPPFNSSDRFSTEFAL